MYCIEMSLATVPAQRTFVLSGSAADWTDLFNRYSKCNAQSPHTFRSPRKSVNFF